MKTEYPVKLFSKIDTPFYYYDMRVLELNIEKVRQVVEKYGFHMHYALKANANKAILKFMVIAGFGADCVSGEEIKAAVDAGFPSASIALKQGGAIAWDNASEIRAKAGCLSRRRE